MEFIVVSHPQSRTVRSGGNAVGSTNQLLAINGGTHTLTLSDPQDYLPPSRRVVVTGTSVATPLTVAFTPVATVFAEKFPAAVFAAASNANAMDTFLAELAPLGLDWHVEKNGVFGTARAQAIFEVNAQTGETWIIASLQDATFAPHRHNVGGLYGELRFTLAGKIKDAVDSNAEAVLGADTVAFYAPNTVHAPSAVGFWAGLFHQPCGATAI